VCVCMCMRVCVVVYSRRGAPVCVCEHMSTQIKHACVCVRVHALICKQTHMYICLMSFFCSSRAEGGVVLSHRDNQWQDWFLFWLVCNAATQLANQLPRRRIQVVRSNTGKPFWCVGFGLLCPHTASSSITSETHTSGAQ